MKFLGIFQCCTEIKKVLDEEERFCQQDCTFFSGYPGPVYCTISLSQYDQYKYGTSYMFPSSNCPACAKDTATITLFSKDEE